METGPNTTQVLFPEKPVVLYVDDEQQNLVSFRISFKREFDVHVATSGPEALEILARTPVELVVTDQRMPDMTGVELLQRVIEQYPTVMRIIITGYSDIGVVVDAINAGQVYRYLSKPWDYQELLQAMNSAIRFYRINVERLHLLRNLEQLVEQRTHELNSALNDLQQKNEDLGIALTDLHTAQQQLVITEKRAALGSLVANIAHEINSPVSAILSTARYSLKQLPQLIERLPNLLLELNDSQLAEFKELVRTAAEASTALSTREERSQRQQVAERLAALGVAPPHEVLAHRLVQLQATDDLKRFAQLLNRPNAEEYLHLADEVGGMVKQNRNVAEAADRILRMVKVLRSYNDITLLEEYQSVDLVATLDKALENHQMLFSKTIEVVRRYSPNLPELMGNAEQLTVAWGSLIHNALLALIPVGGGTLTVAAGHTPENRFWVTVEDTGEGIPSQIQGRIFEPFFTTRPGGQGSGLGLDIARRIVEAHKGTIGVESRPGKTCFRVELPG